MTHLRLLVITIIGIGLSGDFSACANIPTGSGPEVKESPFEGQDDGTFGGGGNCTPDQPACTHACTHHSPGVSGCGGMNPCSLHQRADTYERTGNWMVRTSYYRGGTVTDNNQNSYWCCRTSIQFCEHQAWKECK